MTRIILVEDDPMISEIYQKKFGEAGFDVLAADSGEQALVLAKQGKIDVVLLDLILPRMSGFEVIKNLRSGNLENDMKIFVFSNLNQSEDREKALKLGANGFIVKADFTPSSLVQEIQRLLNQSDEEKKNKERINGTNGENENEKGNGGGQKSKRILIIEDERVFLEMFGEKLTQDGYDVVTADNGAWGVKEAQNGDFDLFIIDMIMPAMTGDEVVAKLKMEDKTKNIPIIILSASVDGEAQKKVEGLGVTAFFVKTQLIPSELSKKVGEILK